MNRWLIERLSSGDSVLVPAIVYYEVRRELLRAGKTLGLARLNAFVEIDPSRYLALIKRRGSPVRSRALGKSPPTGATYFADARSRY